jgi:hypothetical protein
MTKENMTTQNHGDGWKIIRAWNRAYKKATGSIVDEDWFDKEIEKAAESCGFSIIKQPDPISLKNLLKNQNKNRELYDYLSKESEARQIRIMEQFEREFHTPYERFWLLQEHILDKIFENPVDASEEYPMLAALAVVIPGTILVDVGGTGHLHSFAKKLGASSYIAVNRWAIGYKDPADPYTAVWERQERNTQRYFMHSLGVRADALDFVSRIADGSVSFVINGIDEAVIENPRYHECLAKEMSRATAKSGIIFGNKAEVEYQIDGLIKLEADGEAQEFFYRK